MNKFKLSNPEGKPRPVRNFAIHVTSEESAVRILELCQKHNMTRNRVINEMIEFALDNMEV